MLIHEVCSNINGWDLETLQPVLDPLLVLVLRRSTIIFAPIVSTMAVQLNVLSDQGTLCKLLPSILYWECCSSLLSPFSRGRLNSFGFTGATPSSSFGPLLSSSLIKRPLASAAMDDRIDHDDDENLHHIVFEMDSEMLLNIINGCCNTPWNLNSLIARIRLTSLSMNYSFQNMFWKANKVADFMANLARDSGLSSYFDLSNIPKAPHGIARLDSIHFPRIRLCNPS
ncbi:hypothetical protein ACH5RR_008928 [Cinchona calisaya]|uniref:RNase H type-1 domain-containing protein n=1 Tax=Cinchona calisaya TaxID=153742 RepID=A0ABD3ACQ3_9GENT